MHLPRFRITIAVIALLSLVSQGCASSTSPIPEASSTSPLFNLEGTWTGEVKAFQAPGISSKASDYELWVTIRGDQADVWFKWEDHWAPVWDGSVRFSVAQHKSNAVIFASKSKPQVECHWVETWSLTVSQFQRDALETYFYRVVNNTGCPEPRTQFAYGATGRLTRVSSGVQRPQPEGTY